MDRLRNGVRWAQRGRAEVETARSRMLALASAAQQLIDRECDYAEHQMSHDFAGTAEVDQTAAELVFQTRVELFDDGALFEALLLCCAEGVLTRRARMRRIRLDERFVAEFSGSARG